MIECRIKIKAGSGCPATGGMLEVFSVSPKNPHAGSTHLMDSHLMQVINTSFRSLKIIELVKCGFLQNFHCLGRCLDLTKLTISFNEYSFIYKAIFAMKTSRIYANDALI